MSLKGMDPRLKTNKQKNIDKKNVDLIIAAEEAKIKKRQIKERTGNPKVDNPLEEFEKVHGYKFGENIGKEKGGSVAKPKMRPKSLKADKTEIINEEFSKKVARQNAKNKETGKDNLKNLPGSKESLEDNDDIFKKVKKMEKGGEAVPSKYKGFSKLPEKVQQKINPNLATKYEYGGSVKGKGGKMMCRGQGAAIKGGGFSIR